MSILSSLFAQPHQPHLGSENLIRPEVSQTITPPYILLILCHCHCKAHREYGVLYSDFDLGSIKNKTERIQNTSLSCPVRSLAAHNLSHPQHSQARPGQAISIIIHIRIYIHIPVLRINLHHLRTNYSVSWFKTYSVVLQGQHRVASPCPRQHPPPLPSSTAPPC